MTVARAHPVDGSHVDAMRNPQVGAADVRACLDADGPDVHYQPIVHLETGVAIGAETFARFPKGASTLDWFRAAEAADLGPELESRIITDILQSRPQWPNLWEMVCVNVSPERLGSALVRYLLAGSSARNLVVELTDQTALPEDVALRRHLEELRNSGTRIAVSGLQPDSRGQERILRIEPEVVKLDAAALQNIGDDTERRENIGRLVDTCRRSGAFVVAVGVETAEQRDEVKGLGVEAVQGHLYAAPLPLGAAIGASADLQMQLDHFVV